MGSRPSLCKGVPEWPAGICQEGQCPRQNKDHAQIGGDRLMGQDRLMGEDRLMGGGARMGSRLSQESRRVFQGRARQGLVRSGSGQAGAHD